MLLFHPAGLLSSGVCHEAKPDIFADATAHFLYS
jgi:hypothetical protein